jgi:hypothetical protein
MAVKEQLILPPDAESGEELLAEVSYLLPLSPQP